MVGSIAVYWLKVILILGVAASAVVSGIFWVWSARAKVLAPTTSVGGVLGGGIHVKLDTGEVIDFHATYNQQSRYNAIAAYAAAIAALLGAALALLSFPTL
jgi:hypothetical protein